MHSTESRLVIGPKDFPSAGPVCALFSPENLRVRAAKRLTAVRQSLLDGKSLSKRPLCFGGRLEGDKSVRINV